MPKTENLNLRRSRLREVYTMRVRLKRKLERDRDLEDLSGLMLLSSRATGKLAKQKGEEYLRLQRVTTLKGSGRKNWQLVWECSSSLKGRQCLRD